MFSKKALQLKTPTVRYDTVNMQGGMDEVTPILQLPSGMVRDSLNFECSILGGYSRIQGYERYDGHAKPSNAVFSDIYISSFVNVPAVGDTISCATATAVVLAVGSNYLVVTEVTSAFVLGETIKVGATIIGTYVAPSGTISSYNNAYYVSLAANQARTHISAVPGSGPVRGVFVYGDKVYAFRDNVGATSCLLYVESATGWTQIPFFYEVQFTAGTTAPVEGNTLTQGGVTATIKRVVQQSGDWAGSSVGKFIVTAPAGGNFAAGAATAPGSTMTLSGIQTAITFTAGGLFETQAGNFSGQSNTFRMYGCDGVNRCWEFDGTTLVPIDTGFTPDAPNHITIHKNFLFVAVLASLGYSAPGLPYNWTALAGAGVEAVGDNITDFVELPGAQTTAAMAVWTRSTTFILYGTGQSSWNLVPLNTGCGGLPYTAQNMAHTYVFDDRGVIDMQETLNYGNFDIDTITYRVNNFVANKRTKVIGSSLNRHKSQYRLFCSDGYALYITNLHGQYAWMNIASGAMPVLFPDVVNVITEAKISTGDEVTYFGATNGFVYQLDIGTSFDGQDIQYHLTFGFNPVGNPEILKQFMRADIDTSGNSYFEYDFGYTLGFNQSKYLQPNYATYQNDVSVPVWDAFVWDNFTWDGVNPGPQSCEMKGTADGYAIKIKGSSALFNAFNVNTATISYIPRRGKR